MYCMQIKIQRSSHILCHEMNAKSYVKSGKSYESKYRAITDPGPSRFLLIREVNVPVCKKLTSYIFLTAIRHKPNTKQPDANVNKFATYKH